MRRVLAACVLLVIALGIYAVSRGPGSAILPRKPAGWASTVLVTRGIKSDGDADNPRDRDGNGDVDGNLDHDDDSHTPASYYFPDTDDRATFTYGSPADVSTGRSVAEVVRRYFSYAAAADGASACPLLVPNIANSVAEDFGTGMAPYHLRGKTCAGVLSGLFKYLHSELEQQVAVAAVRVKGSLSEAVLGSRSMHAGAIFLQRQGAVWKLRQIFPKALE